MIERIITNIIKSNYIPKYNKYRVEVGIDDEPKKILWLSIKQLELLEYHFESTPKGHSTKNVQVIGVWRENGFYAFSKIYKIKEEKPKFQLPKQYNLDNLNDEEK